MFNHLIKILWFARCCLCALWHLFRYLDSTYPYLYYNVRIKLAKEKHRTAFELIARAVITSSSAYIGNEPINHWILPRIDWIVFEAAKHWVIKLSRELEFWNEFPFESIRCNHAVFFFCSCNVWSVVAHVEIRNYSWSMNVWMKPRCGNMMIICSLIIATNWAHILSSLVDYSRYPFGHGVLKPLI